MKKDEAITIHIKPENYKKFPVFVWQEGGDLVTDVDGQVFRASTAFGLDSKLSEAGIPAPRNLYFVDEPDYESVGATQ
mgnify:CR=1 FL=1